MPLQMSGVRPCCTMLHRSNSYPPTSSLILSRSPPPPPVSSGYLCQWRFFDPPSGCLPLTVFFSLLCSPSVWFTTFIVAPSPPPAPPPFSNQTVSQKLYFQSVHLSLAWFALEGMSDCVSSPFLSQPRMAPRLAPISMLKPRSSSVPTSDRKRFQSLLKSQWIPSPVSFLLVGTKSGLLLASP